MSGPAESTGIMAAVSAIFITTTAIAPAMTPAVAVSGITTTTAVLPDAALSRTCVVEGEKSDRRLIITVMK